MIKNQAVEAVLAQACTLFRRSPNTDILRGLLREQITHMLTVAESKAAARMRNMASLTAKKVDLHCVAGEIDRLPIVVPPAPKSARLDKPVAIQFDKLSKNDAYMVVPRMLAASMTIAWQERFVDVMEELAEQHPQYADREYAVNLKSAKTGRFVKDELGDYKTHPTIRFLP